MTENLPTPYTKMHLYDDAFMRGLPCEYTPPNGIPIPVWITGIFFGEESVEKLRIQPQQEGAFKGLSNAVHMREEDFILKLPGMQPYSFIELRGNDVYRVDVVMESNQTAKLTERKQHYD